MKKVNKNFIERPRSLKNGWAPYDHAIEKLEHENRWPNPYSIIYKSKSVKSELNRVYGNKCAFCNQVPKGSPLQVEHFRPKDGVKDEVHTGYYWLGYEWTNLLYSCGNCNISKSTQFKLQSGITRLNGPVFEGAKFNLYENLCFSQTIKNEKALLINPENENPDNHLIYLPDGKIYFKTSRGEYTIDTFKLNRDELYIDGRKKILDEIILKLLSIFKNYPMDGRKINHLIAEITRVIVAEIIKPIENNDSFDHFLFTVYNKHQDFILNRFVDPIHIKTIHFTFCRLKNGLDVKLK